MVQINFGISSCSRYAPGVPWEERIMEIPETGELPKVSNVQYLNLNKAKPTKFNVLNYSDVREDKYTELPAIRFKLGSGSSDEIFLIWLGQRREWIAVQHSEWSGEGHHIDESEIGPYALDDYCRDILYRVGSVDKEKVPTNISKMSPSEINSLEKVLTLYLYDHEHVDGIERQLDIRITSSREKAQQESEMRLESIILSKDEIGKLASLSEAEIKRELFSKFGVTNLGSFPGLPKGPYYWIEGDVYKSIGVNIR